MALKDVVVYSHNSFVLLAKDARSHGDSERMIQLLDTLVYLTDPEQSKVSDAPTDPAIKVSPTGIAPAPAPVLVPPVESEPVCLHRFGFTNGNCNKCGVQIFPDETPQPYSSEPVE